MRATRACLPALGLAGIFVYAACASNDEAIDVPSDAPADSGITLSDASAPVSDARGDDGAPPDAGTDGPAPLRCTDAGWCETRYGDGVDNPSFVDLWPLGQAAFAVDPNRGILEYDGAAWHLAYPSSSRLSYVWAVSPDDVWAGGGFGNLVHGVRAGGTWTWSPERVGAATFDDDVVSLWGTSGTDIYFTTNTKLYHRLPGDAGDYAWVVEYQDTQPRPAYNGYFMLRQVTGSGPDDVWVLGTRGLWCATVLHKTQGVYSTVADCTVDCTTGECVPNSVPSAEIVSYSAGRAGFVTSPGKLVATTAGAPYEPPILHAFHVSLSAPAEHLAVPATGAVGEFFWGPSDTELYNAGYGMVVHNSAALSDGGAFSISTIALDGAPLIAGFKIRGTSTSDVWAFGGKYALHRTKP